MMSAHTWWLFSAATLLVILLPGPLSLLMVNNSLNYGVRRSLPAFAGGVSASLCLLSASALGLGALLLASPSVFKGLQVLGALYLFYLAGQSWRAGQRVKRNANITLPAAIPNGRALFGKAFALGASNPKDILFFAAFLPQFISASQPLTGQLLLMIATWALLDLACKLFYACSAHALARPLRSSTGQLWLQRISAALFGIAGGAALLAH
jgi:threonine/homoserine/homoserine lactone efflux protein